MPQSPPAASPNGFGNRVSLTLKHWARAAYVV
jgi:hypothetical protein